MKITPTTVFDFKVAQPDDLPLVMAILAEAAARLKEKGIDWTVWQGTAVSAATTRNRDLSIGAKRLIGITRPLYMNFPWMK